MRWIGPGEASQTVAASYWRCQTTRQMPGLSRSGACCESFSRTGAFRISSRFAQSVRAIAAEEPDIRRGPQQMVIHRGHQLRTEYADKALLDALRHLAAQNFRVCLHQICMVRRPLS
jgi:hypothetical protein